MSAAGRSAVTVFSRLGDPDVVVSVVRRLARSVEGNHDWEQFESVHDEGTLVFRRRMFEPASEFSNVILGAHNFFRNVRTRGDPALAIVLSTIEGCQMMLGVGIDPPLTGEADARWRCLIEVAEATEGLLFVDGNAMVDGRGRLVLDHDGRSGLDD